MNLTPKKARAYCLGSYPEFTGSDLTPKDAGYSL